MKQSIIRKADEAHKRRELFIEVHTKSRFAELKLIHTIWKNKDWNVLGFDSFRQYCRAPEISGGLGISPSWGIQLAETYQKFVKELGMKEQDILEIGARKLYQIKGVVNEKNLAEWVAAAKTLPLDMLAMQTRGIDESTCKHPDIKIIYYCKRCLSYLKHNPKLKVEEKNKK